MTLTSVSGSIKEINDDQTADIISDKLHLSAVHDISGIELSSDVTIEQATTDGNIDIQSLGNLTIEHATTDGNIDIQASGNITIKESQTKTGAITIQAADTITALHIDSKGSLTIQNTEGDIIIDHILSNDKISLNSNQGSILEYDDDLEADIITTHVLLQAEKDIQQLELIDNTTVDAFSNSGTIAIQGLRSLILNDIYASGIDIKTASDILARNLVSTGDSIKLYVAEGDITIGEIQSADDLIIITNRGSILDDSDDNHVDITAMDYITLLASYDIGNDTNIEVAAGSKIVSSSTEKGSINIHGKGDLILETLDTSDGNINIYADGTIKAINIVTGNKDADQDVSCSIISKESVETGIIKSDDTLIIQADSIAQAFGNSQANVAMLTALNGIGSDNKSLELNVNKLGLNTTNNGTFIHNNKDL